MKKNLYTMKDAQRGYRVWDPEEKVWLRNKDVMMSPDGTLWTKHHNRWVAEFLPLEVSYYVGEKDRNGKPVYSGDILETNEAGWVSPVIFAGGGFFLACATGFSTCPEWKKCVIIGNMYESPERLKS